jgi:hypothetical protein
MIIGIAPRLGCDAAARRRVSHSNFPVVPLPFPKRLLDPTGSDLQALC